MYPFAQVAHLHVSVSYTEQFEMVRQQEPILVIVYLLVHAAQVQSELYVLQCDIFVQHKDPLLTGEPLLHEVHLQVE